MNQDEIRAICAEAGLQIAEIQHMDRILVLMPACLDALPDFATLAGISAEIKARSDYQFVTLGIDETIFGTDALKIHDPEECLT